MMIAWSGWLAGALALAVFAAGHELPQDPVPPLPRGVKVVFEQVADSDTPKAKQVQRARLLSLAVERGEAATPFLPPGMFRATYTTTLVLPARDRCRFQFEGRGTVALRINGEPVLDGPLRPGKPLTTTQPVRLKKGDNALEVAFQSLAMGDGQFRLFWSGEEFGFEPLAPERLAVADDDELLAGEQRRLGMRLFGERRCARCHEPDARRIGESAHGELNASGPDLRLVGARSYPGYFSAWLREPRRFRPDATMPAMPLSDQDCDDLAAWLATLGQPLPTPVFAPELLAKGLDRFRQLGCVACHAAPGEALGEPAVDNRIALTFIVDKWQPQALIEYLQNPRANHPDVRMPDLRVSRDEATALAAFLLGRNRPPLPDPKGDADKGKKLAHQQGCARCHALDVQLDERRWPRLRNLKVERGCLADDPRAAGAPDHGLDAAQKVALRAFLPFAEEVPFRQSPLDFAQRQVHAERCTNCHALDGQPSTWARWAQREGAVTPLPKEHDPVAQGVPALTWVGSKLQPSWIERVIAGEQSSPRPWLSARMPAFHGPRGSAFARGLVREHGYGQADEPPVPADAQLAIFGEKLLQQGTGFGCVQCHALGDKAAVQVFEREGIELLTARGRLRHEYYTRWLADPPRLDPDSRMPKYAGANGKTAFTEILGGDAAQQFEAIWQFLGSQPPTPSQGKR
jgi:mono/diheme cytochrome c family protein